MNHTIAVFIGDQVVRRSALQLREELHRPLRRSVPRRTKPRATPSNDGSKHYGSRLIQQVPSGSLPCRYRKSFALWATAEADSLLRNAGVTRIAGRTDFMTMTRLLTVAALVGLLGGTVLAQSPD